MSRISAAPLALGLGCALALALACQSSRRDERGGAGAARGGSDGSSGSGGSGGDTAGQGAGGASGGGGGAASVEDWREIAGALDGFVFTLPCRDAVNERLCRTGPEGPCARDSDPALSGFRATDETLVLGGDPLAVYTVELFVQGLVEAKNYLGGADQASAGELPADGFYKGGRPGGGNAQSIVMIRVADPPADYFLNALASAEDSRLRRSLFPIAYTAQVRARGGTSVRLVLTDPNCYAVRNCADPDEGGCVPHSLEFLDERFASGLSSAWDGQLVGLQVTRVTRD